MKLSFEQAVEIMKGLEEKNSQRDKKKDISVVICKDGSSSHPSDKEEYYYSKTGDMILLKDIFEQGRLKGIKETKQKFIEAIKNHIHCDNCRFACQATECDCVCHNGWINRQELSKLIGEEEQ